MNLENTDNNSNDDNKKMHNVAIDNIQELLENADNMNNGGDSEVPLTIIDYVAPISRLSSARGSLSRHETAQKLSTHTKNKKKRGS